MWTLCVIFMLVYVTAILYISKGWNKVSFFEYHKELPEIEFSIIVPFRNEADNLPDFLESVSNIDYSQDKYEIILIDDNSEDDSVSLIEQFRRSHSEINIEVHKNSEWSKSFKKDAIRTGIEHARFDWILTTDADCILPPLYLNTFNAFTQRDNIEMIAGPVSFHNGNNLLSNLQYYDLIALQAIGIGSYGLGKPFLCNGANFGYTKNLYGEINGFEGNDHIGSGDDLFLLNKVTKHDYSKIGFLKSSDALVFTEAQKNWSDLLNQRRRWAKKTIPLNNTFGTVVTIIGLLGNLSILFSFVLLFFGMIGIELLVALFALKVIIDHSLMRKASSGLGLDFSITWFLISSLVYPFFVFTVAITSLNKSYIWKGRRYDR